MAGRSTTVTFTDASAQSTPFTKRHQRNSSLWVPPGVPLTDAIRTNIVAPLEPLRHRFGGRHTAAEEREITPNWLNTETPRYKLPNAKYGHNRIRTSKYTLWTFLPKNLWEQLHRWANLYFIMVCCLNFVPAFSAFNAYLSILPVAIILAATAVKDGIEDYRRVRSDRKINRNTVYVFDPEAGRPRKMYWEHVMVGDLIHVANDETIPADIVLVRSSDPQGTVFVETANLDGENNLKQRSVLSKCKRHCRENSKFNPYEFDVNVFINQPDKRINYIHGSMSYNHTGDSDMITKENVILRGCQVRNTSFVEGIVLYTGKETKAMMNNGSVRYKRSTLERATNKFIVYCILILLFMCISGGTGSIFWLVHYEAHSKNITIPFLLTYTKSEILDGLINFGSFIISYQVLIPLALYISVELIKLGQIYLINQDIDLYYDETDRRIECRSLNIPEELGQIQYVLSDKTGTLTENKMIFRSCAVNGFDYQADPKAAPSTDEEREVKVNETLLQALHRIDSNALNDSSLESHGLFYFFLNLSICNTVMAHRKPHEDNLEHGYVEDEVYYVGNSAFYSKTDAYDQPSSSTELLGTNSSEMPTPMSPPCSTLQTPLTPSTLAFSELPTPGTPPNGTPYATETPTAINTPTASKSFYINTSDLVRRISSLGKLKFLRRENGRNKKHKAKAKERIYEAESPDELCLVYAAKAYGFTLQNRCPDSVTVEIPNKNSLSGVISLQLSILKILPFDSDRKRMSIIVDFEDRYLLLCKGADDEVLSNLSEEFKRSPKGNFVIENSRQILQRYASDGMRTLAIAMRFISQDEYEAWVENHERIEANCIDDRDEQISQSARLIEKDMELLGVTAIEDRLQDGVAETIQGLREAGIQVWVLTGDKLETAKNIALSCQLFDPEADELLFDEESDVECILNLQKRGFNVLLSGKAVKLLKEGHKGMLEVVRRSAAILCYRMTPAEKADVVKVVKKHFKGKVLAVGDGANDVPMILNSDVGVGISGQEGLQAVMSSDFALARFRFLHKLLLVHGHWCYYRLANILFYYLVKNAVLVLIIYWAQIFNGFSGQSPLDPIYMMLYPIVFTSVQPIVYGACDQDISASTLLEEPRLYNKGRLGSVYRSSIFAANMLDAAWQSLVIYFIAHLAYFETEVDMWTFGFLLCSSLFCVNSLHLALLTRAWSIPVVCVHVFFVLVHFGFFIGYTLIATPAMGTQDVPLNVAVNAMGSIYFWAVLFITCIVALTPRFVIKLVQNRVSPGLVYEEALKRKTMGNNVPCNSQHVI